MGAFRTGFLVSAMGRTPFLLPAPRVWSLRSVRSIRAAGGLQLRLQGFRTIRDRWCETAFCPRPCVLASGSGNPRPCFSARYFRARRFSLATECRGSTIASLPGLENRPKMRELFTIPSGVPGLGNLAVKGSRRLVAEHPPEPLVEGRHPHRLPPSFGLVDRKHPPLPVSAAGNVRILRRCLGRAYSARLVLVSSLLSFSNHLHRPSFEKELNTTSKLNRSKTLTT